MALTWPILAAVVASLYGILNDQITVTFSLEYFSVFKRQEFWFPAPHAHSYQPENDEEEERLMKRCNWKYSPLKEQDEW